MKVSANFFLTGVELFAFLSKLSGGEESAMILCRLSGVNLKP